MRGENRYVESALVNESPEEVRNVRRSGAGDDGWACGFLADHSVSAADSSGCSRAGDRIHWEVHFLRQFPRRLLQRMLQYSAGKAHQRRFSTAGNGDGRGDPGSVPGPQ